VIAIATEGDQQMRQLADHTIFVPHTAELLSPILEIVPLQLFAYYMTVKKGLDVDRPRNLVKSVSVE
jgi:glucosamine--fructose-6-phosphate aminotransferase (isomerizing)